MSKAATTKARLRRKELLAGKRERRIERASRQAGVTLNRDQVDALDQAGREREDKLKALAREVEQRVEKAHEEGALERRKIWAEYDERRDTMLKAARKAA